MAKIIEKILNIISHQGNKNQNTMRGVPVVAQQKRIRLVCMRMRVRSLASFRLGIRCCHEPWCRSQTQLGSHIVVAVVQAGTIAQIGPLAWKHPHAMGAALKRQKTNKKTKVPLEEVSMLSISLSIIYYKSGLDLFFEEVIYYLRK